ncbi:mechanosensitive ion channel family protein [Pelagicoccus sp. SDUM812002]|uniref:mechanosensitive ion channel family protein n=1 Tax=Pelagicoccus sp. SDUM812002 TaxID=3041266 RepID=UPI00280E5CFA|nr:mechanosensitive ion channel family protein [Pelagicoccus sp. SDUM812002]MDQ8186154.1 mechanosensitive ion channel family protein [Pelagicoccus sp. SDUM812002]
MKVTKTRPYLWLIPLATFAIALITPISAQEEGEQEDSIVITIPGGQIEEQPQESANTAPQPETSGRISRSIQKAIPDTGSPALDSSVRTFTRAVGNLVEGTIRSLPQITIAIFALIFTAIVASIVQRVAKGVFRRMRLRRSLSDLFAQLIYVAIWFLGIMLACGIIFPSFGLAELVGTAGLMSIAIGFAFRDIFENFFAGILILWRFPFEIDDFIEIESENIMGRVEDIWIRMTLIRLTTGELVTVPNATVYKSPIRILTNRDLRRITVEAGVAYGEDVGEARAVIRKAVEACKSVSKQKPIDIFLTGFGSSSMDYDVTWWTGAKPRQQRESRDEVVEAVKRGLDEAGIEIPYPYRTLTFTKNEPLIYDKLAPGGQEQES